MALTGHIEVNLLRGCYIEADRAEIVAYGLEGLRATLPAPLHPHLTVTIEEIKRTCKLLRALGDNAQVYFNRAPVVLNYLEIVLPCLSRSLRDITAHYEDVSLSRENRWRKMYHSMTNEAGGLLLPQRFIVYNHFLSLLQELLTRSPSFDFNSLETVRLQIMKLREARDIPPPIRVPAAVCNDALVSIAGPGPAVHWAEQIFSLPLPSRTELKQQQVSKSFGPHLPSGHVNMPSDAKVLFLRPFNENRLSLTVYTSGRESIPYLLLRTYYMGSPWYALHGAHELCIDRDESCLQFKQWSSTEQCAKLWASLCFMTWEELVLLYCSFLSLKARNPLTVQIAPAEYVIRSEKKLFQARILDDGYKHSLVVYRDRYSRGIRLHAAVWDGELRQCPVWTAFVTHQSASPTWLKRASRHRIRLADIQLYVFCQNYRQENQRRGAAGAFEIYFISEEASQSFAELFSPGPDPTVATESTDV